MGREETPALELVDAQIKIKLHLLGEIIPDYQTNAGNPKFLSRVLEQWDTLVDRAKTERTRLGLPDLADRDVRQAKRIAAYLDGQDEIDLEYFTEETDGLAREIEALVKPRAEAWRVGGKNYKTEQEARRAAANLVLAARDEKLDQTLEELRGKHESGQKLTAKESGRYIAAHILRHEGGRELVIATETRITRRVGEEIGRLEGLGNNLKGLDSREAETTLEEARRVLPEPALLTRLANKDVVVLGLGGQNTSALGRELARRLISVVKETTGMATVSPREILAGNGLDVGQLKSRINGIVDPRIDREIQEWFVGSQDKPGGLIAFSAELANAGVGEKVIDEWAIRNNKKVRLRALQALDLVFRETSPKLAGTDEPNKTVADIIDTVWGKSGAVTLAIDGDTAASIWEICQTINPLALEQDFDGRRLDRFQQEVVKRSRFLFAVEGPPTKFGKLLRYPGFPSYIEWCMTDRGSPKNKWLEGDTVDPGNFLSLEEYYKGAGVKNAADSIGLEKALVKDYSPIMRLAAARDRARRAGINLVTFAHDIRDEGTEQLKSEAEIRVIAKDYCQDAEISRGHTQEAMGLLVESLVEISPFIREDTDGLFNQKELIKMVASREATLNYAKLPTAIRGELFKHLDSRTKLELFAVIYHETYEPFFNQIIRKEVTSGHDCLNIVMEAIGGEDRFYAMEIYAATGVNFFEDSWKGDIAEFLANKGPDFATFADQVGKLKIDDELAHLALPDWVVDEIMTGMGIDITGTLPQKNYEAWRAYMDKQLGLLEKRYGSKSDLYLRYLHLSDSDPVLAFIARLREAATLKWEADMKGARANRGGIFSTKDLGDNMLKWRGEGLIKVKSDEDNRIIRVLETGLTSQETAGRNAVERLRDWVAKQYNDKIHEGLFRLLWTSGEWQGGRGFKLPILELPIGEWAYKIMMVKPRAIFVVPFEYVAGYLAGVPWRLSNLVGFPDVLLKVPVVGPLVSPTVFALEKAVYFNFLGVNVGSFLVFTIGGTWLQWRIRSLIADGLLNTVVRGVLRQYPPRPYEPIPGFDKGGETKGR